MILRKINLQNFRNYEKAEKKFDDGVNFFVAPNGFGKTNVIEAIAFLATAKSHRGAKESAMARLGCAPHPTKFSASFFARNRENTVEARWTNNDSFLRKKMFLKNDVPVQRTSELMGFLTVVVFSPDDLQLVKGAPSKRRKMLDLAICQLSKKYFENVSSLHKVIAQKNFFLKKGKENANLLNAYNEQIASFSAQIRQKRMEYLHNINEHSQLFFKELIGKKMIIEYDEETDRDRILVELNLAAEKEKRRGQSLIGAHRDDFRIVMEGEEAKFYASQGQQRCAVVAMKMAMVEEVLARTGERPVLLLDDVLSELDNERQKFILQLAKGGQTIITNANEI